MMPRNITRSQFLRGDLSGRRSPIRPPWAVPERLFQRRCDACGACIQVCPEGLLDAGRGGLPVVDFTAAACSFCGLCVQACSRAALIKDSQAGPRRPWALQAELSGECLAEQAVLCRICGEHCDLNAIRFRPSAAGVAGPVIDTQRCNGCGNCLGPCPTRAIAIQVPSPQARGKGA